MIDNLIVADSIYDEDHHGQVLKKRASLDKDYGRIGITVDDDKFGSTETHSADPITDFEPDDNGLIQALGGIPLMDDSKRLF